MDEMKRDMNCDEATFFSVIHGCAQTRDWASAERLLADMRKLGFKPNDAYYYVLLAAASKAGELELAESFLKSMRTDGLTPDLYAYTTVFGCCGRKKDWRAALKLLEAMKGDGILPTKKIFNAALKACSDGEAEVAVVMLEMIGRQGLELDDLLCASAIVALGRGKRADKALAIFEGMRKSGPPPNREYGPSPPPAARAHSHAITATVWIYCLLFVVCCFCLHFKNGSFHSQKALSACCPGSVCTGSSS